MNIYKNLEFDIILDTVAGLASSPVVAKKITECAPCNDINAVNKLLTQTGDAINVLASHRPNLFFEDITPIIDKAEVGAVLAPVELLKIKDSITALHSLKSCVEGMDECDSLKDITAWARECDELRLSIDNTVENETDIKDSASEQLYAIRRSIQRANARLKEKLDSYSRQSDISKYLRDNIVTLRAGRYVLPVRSDCKSAVKGLVHDVSSTGATVFIEPFAVVEANNELITLKNEENNEIERILAQLSKEVVQNSAGLIKGQEVLIECGVIFAKAEYAKKFNAYRPIINDDGVIVLCGARHPLIPAADVVPVDINLDERRVLLISGPNTGGKTVALKTVGLFALLAACGMFIPANDGSQISIFDDIYCDIGDKQSIAQSLSTFSAHVTNLVQITRNISERSLVLLDEVGDGTDPEEGAALAIAIIKRIIERRAVAVVTTHFGSVKEFALGCKEVASACMQFDNVNFKPTYKLLQGVSGSSCALEIAEKLGLDSEIISDARAAFSEEKIAFDKIMKEAEKLRNDMLHEKQQCKNLRLSAENDAKKAATLRADYENKLADIKENARSIIKRQADEYANKADELIEQIKEQLKSANESALFEARKTAKKIYDGVPIEKVRPKKSDSPIKPEQLAVGVRVYVSGLNKEGIIASSPRGNKVVVAIGSIKTDVPVSSLTVLEETESKKIKEHVKVESEPENREIMLLGFTVDDAVEELDRIISDIAPRSTLRIVHGKGTGALGKGIQAYLRKQPRIKSFRYGRYGEGDNGVTIAEIK